MTDSLASALAQLQADLPRITKGETAKVDGKTKDGRPFSYTYAYAGLAHVSAEILPLLGKLGLSWATMPTLNEQGKFVLSYRLAHANSGAITGEYPLPAQGTPQEMGSAITYARRYCLCAVTGVAPDDDDDDGAAATKAQQSRARAKPTAPRAPEAETESPFNKPDTEEQRKQRKMHALFNTVGLRLREERLAYTSEVIGRPIETSKDLTDRELAQLLETLDRWAAQSEPPGKEVTS